MISARLKPVLAAMLACSGISHGALLYVYDASTDTPGDGTWTDDEAAGSEITYTFNGASPSPVVVNSSGFTSAYRFNMQVGDPTSATNGGAHPELGNASATDRDASFEVWFRPSDMVGTEPLFETGGVTRGAAIALVDGNVEMRMRDNGTVQTVTTALPGGIGDFIQAVGVIEYADLDGQGDNLDYRLTLYVNAITGPGSIVQYDDRNDHWAGTDGTGIAGRQGDAGPFGATGNFTGEIALVRLYDNALSGAEVSSLYNAQIPEPSSLMLGAFGSLMLLRRRR